MMKCFDLINKTDGNPPTFDVKQLFWDVLDRFDFSPFTKICIYFAIVLLAGFGLWWLKNYFGAHIARKGELTAEKKEVRGKNKRSHSEFEDRLERYSHTERNHPNDYHYRSGSVDFIGRNPEMKILQNFCQATQHILWTAILADGGSGKSRLAYEFYKKQKGETDWYSIFITGTEAAELASLSDIQCQKNVLIIIDYFGCKAESISKLLAKWPKGNGRLRLLLLEREVPKEDHFRAQWYTAFSEYRGMLYSGSFIFLSSMPDQIEAIAKSYAKHKNYSLSSAELQSIHALIDQIDPEKHRPLFVICIVDAICRGELANTWSQSDLLEDICRHEEARILSAVKVEKQLMEYLLCFASMCGGISESMSHSFPLEVQNAWNSLGENHLSIFHSINGTSNDAGILAPLEPDIIREKFVLSILAKMTICSRNRWIHAAWETQPERFAEFLIRIIEDFGCEAECTADLVYQIFDVVPKNPYAQEFYAIAVSSITQWEWMEKSRQSKAVEKLHELFKLTTCEKIGELYAIALYNILTISDDIHEKASAFSSLSNLFSTTHSAKISIIYAVGILFLFTTGSNIFTNIEYISQLEQLYKRFPSPVTESAYAGALFSYSTYEECIEKGWVIAKLEEVFNSVSSGIVDESYANALINMISAEKNVVKKQEYFCKLKAIYQKRKKYSK